jgi:predicted glycogen debranching enzyme
VQKIVDAYLRGTRFGIGVDDDGLLRAAAPGLQLTWMDAKVGDWVVTPRAGKPVEIQALWIAALEAAARLLAPMRPGYAHELTERAAGARSSFAAAFWDDALGYLYDVIDGPRRDSTLRPNQLWALGLCAPLVAPPKAARALDACERELVTRVGLRTRARGPGYLGRYLGDQRARDAAYHQGTVWPYLYGAYADACMRVRGRLPEGLLDGVAAHLEGDGLGTVHEIFDGDSPHEPRGCPAQAWSVTELYRVALGRVGDDA